MTVSMFGAFTKSHAHFDSVHDNLMYVSLAWHCHEQCQNEHVNLNLWIICEGNKFMTVS